LVIRFDTHGKRNNYALEVNFIVENTLYEEMPVPKLNWMRFRD